MIHLFGLYSDEAPSHTKYGKTIFNGSKGQAYIYINQQLVHEFIDNRILDSSINRLLPHTSAIKELYAIKQISFTSVLTNQDGVRDCLAFLHKAIAHRQYLRIILLIARKKQGEE